MNNPIIDKAFECMHKKSLDIDEYISRIDSCIEKCVELESIWQKLADMDYGYIRTSFGAVHTVDGVCDAIKLNEIGIYTKYEIFKTWDKAYVGMSVVYPVDGEYEYESSLNLFRSEKRKSLFKHIHTQLIDLRSTLINIKS